MNVTEILGDSITGLYDVTGEAGPGLLLPFMVRRCGNILSDEKFVWTDEQIRFRRQFNKIVKLVGPMFLKHKQIFEDRNVLAGKTGPDEGVTLPDRSVIWAANHGFKEDVLGSVLAIRHSFILVGSLPVFFNSFDGFLLYLNGVVLMNRKIRNSKTNAISKAKDLLIRGCDILIYPEGVWNKTPEKLLLHFWPGVYRLAIETGAPVIPVIHYIRDPHGKRRDNPIHTVVDKPVEMNEFSEEQGLRYLRDVMATWYYLMMERYGKTTREEIIKGDLCTDDAWSRYLALHTGDVGCYDTSIETVADYQPKDDIRPKDVFETIAKVKNRNQWNLRHILQAEKIIERDRRRDFQSQY